MFAEEVEFCHICKVSTDHANYCPQCTFLTCEDCFAPQCETSTEVTTDCKTCHDEYENDPNKKWIQEKIETIRWNASHNRILLTIEVNQWNCIEVEAILNDGIYRITKVTVGHNFVGDPYFKIRLFSHDVDPWEKENRAP